MAAIVEFETIPQLLTNLVNHFDGKNRTILGYKDKQTKEWVDISWEELNRQIHALAGFLHSRGVRKGDRVAILAENRPEWAVIDLATQILGAINVSLYTTLPASQVAYIMRDSGSKIFFVSSSIQLRKAEEIFDECPDLQDVVTMSEMRKERPDYIIQYEEAMTEGETYLTQHRGEIDEMKNAVTPEDLSALIYTSGTTGNPKGVMLTHINFCSNVRSALPLVPFGPDDHHLSFLPLCHSFERTAGYTAVLACGAKITYAESIDTVSRNLVEVHPTVMISVPRLFERVYNLIAKSVEEGSVVKKAIFNWARDTGMKAAIARTDGGRPGPLLRLQQNLAHRLVFSKLHEKLGGNLRFAVSGGAALPRKIGEFFQAAGITIIEGYGLTETSPVLTVNPIEKPRYGSVGHVIPGVTIAIQRTSDLTIIGQISGNDYPTDLTTDEGEILVRGPNIMKGYWNDEHATREVIDTDGWFHTGDIGRFDDGYVLITDRIKHMIVSKGGKNIYPGPIEDQFKTFPFVDQILVVGEAREFLSALVVPNIETIESFAKEQGIAYSEPSNLLKEKPVLDVFQKEFKTYSRSAAAHEKIRDFRLIAEPFTVENAMLTPTLKPRRRVIEKRYADLIDEMYRETV